MVLIIEQGIELYGVGRMRQVSVILDRGTVPYCIVHVLAFSFFILLNWIVLQMADFSFAFLFSLLCIDCSQIHSVRATCIFHADCHIRLITYCAVCLIDQSIRIIKNKTRRDKIKLGAIEEDMINGRERVAC
jgi:hypothetical protein